VAEAWNWNYAGRLVSWRLNGAFEEAAWLRLKYIIFSDRRPGNTTIILFENAERPLIPLGGRVSLCVLTRCEAVA
jgi:hypothetical protein